MSPRFQEEALTKVSKAARLLLGLLCCWQRAVGSQQEGIGHGQSCGREGLSWAGRSLHCR